MQQKTVEQSVYMPVFATQTEAERLSEIAPQECEQQKTMDGGLDKPTPRTQAEADHLLEIVPQGTNAQLLRHPSPQ